jgi:hypothetical protein
MYFKDVIPDEAIMARIYLIRGQKVMLDRDLSELYGVETKVLKRQVRRNLSRFPHDFMFELTASEFSDLRSQIGTSSWGGTRYVPMAFTEQGVAMLSSVLSSGRAIEVNIRIIRIFARMREILHSNKELLTKLEQLECKVTGHNKHIRDIFQVLKKLLHEPVPPRRRIGFKTESGEQT